VIHPQNATGRSDNVTWDDEWTLVVSDWYHREHEDLLRNDFLTWKNPTGAEPVPSGSRRALLVPQALTNPTQNLP
jgi:iron transport multicopper oxidase